jgi:hypothetical protein
MSIYLAELKRREALEGPESLRGVSSSTLRLAATLEKTIANIKADPTHPINIRLTEILCDWRDNMKAGKVLHP